MCIHYFAHVTAVDWNGVVPTDGQWESLGACPFEKLEDIKGTQSAISSKCFARIVAMFGPASGLLSEHDEAEGGDGDCGGCGLL